MLVEAPSKVGELETLVIMYVRRTCERGSEAKVDMADSLDCFVWNAAGGDVLLDIVSADSSTGRDFGADVCILRRLELRLPPSWNRYVQHGMYLCFCRIFASTASGVETRRQGFIVMEERHRLQKKRREVPTVQRECMIALYIQCGSGYHAYQLECIGGYLRPSHC